MIKGAPWLKTETGKSKLLMQVENSEYCNFEVDAVSNG